MLGVNRVCCLRDVAADTPWKKGKTKEELEMSAMIGLASDKMLSEDDECLRCAIYYGPRQTWNLST